MELLSKKLYAFSMGGWILATSPCVLAWVYTWDSLLNKDIKRLWPIHKYKHQICSIPFGVHVYGEVLYLEFYSVFSEQFINYVPVKMESSTHKK